MTATTATTATATAATATAAAQALAALPARVAGLAGGSWRALLQPRAILLAGAALLAAQPLAWLASTRRSDSYNAEGVYAAIACLLLALWSLGSARTGGPGLQARHALVLLAVSAAVRLAGQLLRVNVLGALTLSLDVCALASLAGLDRRERSVSPGWLAVLFSFALPLERVLQRSAGYALQQLSADGACGLLRALGEPVQCLGTRLLLGGQDLLVDLPCSGARALVTLLALFAACAAVVRPTAAAALAGLGAALAGALAANVLRLAVMALWLAHPQWFGGASPMAAPWHELLGLAALALGAIPVLWWALRSPARPRAAAPAAQSPGHDGDDKALHTTAPAAAAAPAPAPAAAPAAAPARPLSFAAALAFLALSCAVVAAPARPLDVARVQADPALPARLLSHAAAPDALTATERAYFARYGGGAGRAGYGPFGLLLVRTSAPLRHLHAPDECLRGLGHSVRYAGLVHGALPTALYDSTDPQGRRWRIAVTYLSDRGDAAASVAHAVWLWLQHGGTWTQVQRSAPADLPAAQRQAFDAAVARSLDLPAADAAAGIHLAPPGA